MKPPISNTLAQIDFPEKRENVIWMKSLVESKYYLKEIVLLRKCSLNNGLSE